MSAGAGTVSVQAAASVTTPGHAKHGPQTVRELIMADGFGEIAQRTRLGVPALRALAG